MERSNVRAVTCLFLLLFFQNTLDRHTASETARQTYDHFFVPKFTQACDGRSDWVVRRAFEMATSGDETLLTKSFGHGSVSGSCRSAVFAIAA